MQEQCPIPENLDAREAFDSHLAQNTGEFDWYQGRT